MVHNDTACQAASPAHARGIDSGERVDLPEGDKKHGLPATPQGELDDASGQSRRWEARLWASIASWRRATTEPNASSWSRPVGEGRHANTADTGRARNDCCAREHRLAPFHQSFSLPHQVDLQPPHGGAGVGRRAGRHPLCGLFQDDVYTFAPMGQELFLSPRKSKHSSQKLKTVAEVCYNKSSDRLPLV